MPRAAEVFLALVACCLLVVPASAIFPDQLPALINQVLAEPQFNHSDWGIQIVTKFPNGTIIPLFSNNPSQFFVPASNNKVPTTAAAFLYLGPDFHVQTPVYGSFQSSSSSGFLQDLCLVGQGDASIFSNKQLYQLVRTLTQRYALSDIDQLSVDDSTLPASFPTSWEWMDLVDTDGAQPNSLIVNENALTLTVTPSKTVSKPPTVSFNYPGDQVCIEVVNNAVTVGFDTPITEPLTIGYVIGKSGIFISGQMLNTSKPVSWSGAALSPAERFECLLKWEFNSDSVFVNKSSVQNCNPCKGQPLSSCSLPANQHLLATIPSPALKITMNHTLQESDNLFAEAFLRLLGLRWGAATGSKADAFSAGLSAVISLLSAKGVDTSLFKQYDGSGLSRHNLMSPEAMVQIFSMMYDQPNGDIYRSFLPVAGESGTLKSRMVGTTAQGVIHAKTGTMTGVNSLSGYMINDSFPTVVFSIIVNDSNQSSSVVRPGIDQICVYLSQLQVPPSWSL